MAVDAQIDSLRIDIETNITSDPKRIDEIYESLKRLKSITEEKWSGLDEVVNKINKLGAINQTAFAGFNQSLQTVTSGISNLQQVVSTPLQTEQGRLIKEFEIVNDRINTINENYKDYLNTLKTPLSLELARQSGVLQSFEQDLIKNYRKLDSITVKLQSEQNKLTKELDYAGKAATRGSSAFDKLVLSIKRITFYRVVRRAIQLIGKEILGAIQNFARFDDATNEAISGLMSSWKASGNSIGLVVSQLINTAAPFLIYILRLATDVANAISLIFASISGEEYYTKAIEYEVNYRDELDKTNKMLLGFDRFNVLQQQAPDVSEMFKTEEVATGWAKMSDGTLALVSAIETLIALKLVGWLSDVVSGIKSFIQGITAAEASTKSLTLASGALKSVGLFLLIYAIMELVTKWDELDDGMKAVWITVGILGGALIILSNTTILKTVINALKTFVSSLATTKTGLLKTTEAVTGMQAATAALTAGIVFLALDTWFSSMDSESRKFAGTAAIIIGSIMAIVAAIVAMKTALTPLTLTITLAGIAAAIAGVKALIPDVSYHAQGGIPDTRGGSMFVMNEGGKPELIHENSRGQVQISNQESLQSAFLGALRQFSYENPENKTINVNIGFDTDGNAAARWLRPYWDKNESRIGNR